MLVRGGGVVVVAFGGGQNDTARNISFMKAFEKQPTENMRFLLCKHKLTIAHYKKKYITKCLIAYHFPSKTETSLGKRKEKREKKNTIQMLLNQQEAP